MNTRVNRLMGCKLVYVAAFLLGPGAVARAQMPAPEPLVVTAVTANTAALAWNDIYSDEDGFLLTRWDSIGNETTFQFGPNVTNYLDTNLITDATYTYRVVAFNSGGQSYGAFASATPTPIAAPEPLLITGVTANTIGLSWNDIYANEDGFLLTRWDSIGNETTFQFGPNVTSYLDTNLITDAVYTYRVVAFNSGGQSYGAFASATPTSIAAPEPLLITGVTANTIGLSWNDIYSDEDGFLLTRWDSIGNETTFQFGPNVTNYLDTNLITDATYTYRVVAFNSGGQSYGAFASATPTPIAAPEPLLITGVTANTIGLSWNDIYTNEDGFLLTRWDNIGNEATFRFGPNVTSYVDTNLITDAVYTYRVVAFNSGGQSYGAFASATPTPIAAPEPLLITGVTANTIGLSWNDIYTNEDGFLLTRWDSIGNETTFQFGPNVTSYLDTNLITDAIYTYRVVAFNSGGQSYGAFASSTPTPIPAPAPLVVSGVTANTVSLVWNDIYDDEGGFILTRWDSIGNQTVFDFGPNVTSYLDTNLITGSVYYYQVVAFNWGGQSYPAFNSATPTPIAAPAPLLITGVTANTVGLAWNDIYSNEDGFSLTRWDNLGNQSTFQFGPNVTSYVDTNLITGTTYYYQVVAFNSGGQSAAAFNSATPMPTPPPYPLLITAVTADAISLAWSDIYTNEDGFQLERSTDNVNFATVTVTGPNVTNYTDSALTQATTYYYRVAAFNSGGTSAYATTNTMTVLNPPAAPSGLTATAVFQTEIDLSWIDNADNETEFDLERSTDGVNFTPVAFMAGANWTSYGNIGLRPATTYYFRVRAVNAAGPSAWSNVGTATTPDYVPVSPSDLSATAISAAQINLTWEDNSTNETGFNVYISGDGTNFTMLAAVLSNVTAYASTGLTPATAYYYRVSAFNGAGESDPSDATNATTQDVVSVSPSGLSATAISATQMNLSWTDNADNESGFKVYISTNGTTFSLLATLGANVTSCSSTGLNPATTYYYRVTAFNAVGESASSNANATTQDVVPVSASGLSAAVLSATQINVSWTDNANNESGFKVYVSTNGTTFSLLATLGANVTSYASTGLNSATTYYYRVTAFNAVGESASSNANATTHDVVPVSPSGLVATTISATQINLSWSDNANNESGFNVYISTNGTTFNLSATLGANAPSYSSPGLNPATIYYYRVAAFNAVGESAPSGTASTTTLDVPPLAPSGLSASTVSSNRVAVSWTDNAANESGFLIERSADGINFTQIGTVGAGVTTYADSGLAASTTYHYRVRATNSAGNSAYSNIASATTGAAAPPAAPSNLTLTVVSASQLDLHWNDNSSNETQFLIERSLNGTTFTQIATVGSNIQSYSAAGLQSNTRYYFRARAVNSAGNSAYSNTANAKTSH